MKKHTAFFEDGSIIEQFATQRGFKATVADWRKTGAGRVWFRPCKAWRKASTAHLDSYAHSRGFQNYVALCSTLPFIPQP